MIEFVNRTLSDVLQRVISDVPLVEIPIIITKKKKLWYLFGAGGVIEQNNLMSESEDEILDDKGCKDYLEYHRNRFAVDNHWDVINIIDGINLGDLNEIVGEIPGEGGEGGIHLVEMFDPMMTLLTELLENKEPEETTANMFFFIIIIIIITLK
jgi:hypothetical protein